MANNTCGPIDYSRDADNVVDTTCNLGCKIDLSSIMCKVDNVLNAQGLYEKVEYLETVQDEVTSTYDPISSTFSDEFSTLHIFSAVLLTEDQSNEPNNTYGGTLKMLVIPANIAFIPEVDQVYSIYGVRWQVVNLDLAPQEAIFTINLRRK
jgi:hypothetical protein